MNIGSRQLSFRMTGEPDPEGEGRPAPRVAPSNLRRLPPGEWTHIVITHDGTGERAGMNVFRNGDVVEASGSEYFTRAIGSIRTGLPLELGRGRTRGRGGRDELEMRYFNGGGIADLRVFNRPLTVQEAKVVSLWSTLEQAREKHPDALDEAEREAPAALLPEREGRVVSRGSSRATRRSSASGARCGAGAASPT